jgi:diguanylate cyclase (GGDEF)-like protein
MPGGYFNWQEERQGVLFRLLFIVLGLGIAFFSQFPLEPFWTYVAVGISVLQTLVAQVAIPRRYSWFPNFIFYVNRLVWFLLLGATGGAGGPIVVGLYAALAAALVYYNSPRAVLIQVLSYAVTLFAGTAFSVYLGFALSWNFAALHSISLLMMALVLMRPLSQLTLYAATDPLTKALNRRGGLEQLETWASEGKRFSLIFVDLKRFKHINDTYGHGVGDEVLAWVVKLCKNNLRGTDLVIRYGGDEFVLVLTGKTEPILQRLESLLIEGVETSAGRLSIQANLGVVRFPEDGRDLEQLLQQADQQMYLQKGIGLVGS